MEKIEPLQMPSTIDQDLAEAAWRKMVATGSATPTFKLGDKMLDVEDHSDDFEEDRADGANVMTVTLRHEESRSCRTVCLRRRPGKLWKMEKGMDRDMDEKFANLILRVLRDSEILSEANEAEDTAQAYEALLMAAGRVDED